MSRGGSRTEMDRMDSKGCKAERESVAERVAEPSCCMTTARKALAVVPVFVEGCCRCKVSGRRRCVRLGSGSAWERKAGRTRRIASAGGWKCRMAAQRSSSCGLGEELRGRQLRTSTTPLGDGRTLRSLECCRNETDGFTLRRAAVSVMQKGGAMRSGVATRAPARQGPTAGQAAAVEYCRRCRKAWGTFRVTWANGEHMGGDAAERGVCG